MHRNSSAEISIPFLRIRWPYKSALKSSSPSGSPSNLLILLKVTLLTKMKSIAIAMVTIFAIVSNVVLAMPSQLSKDEVGDCDCQPGDDNCDPDGACCKYCLIS